MSNEFRLAYVGPADAVSPWMLRAIGQSAARFVAVCCDDAGRAERAATEYHARWAYHDVRAMLSEAQPHGVVVAGPWAERAAVIRPIVSAGAAVLTAGLPIAPSRGWTKGGAFVFGAAAGRFSPAGTLVRRLIESGKLGELLSVSVSYTHCKSARNVEESAWPVSRDTMFEAADWTVALTGGSREVFARGHPDGAIAATIVGPSDVPITLRVHEHGRPEQSGLSLEVRGVDGTLLLLDRHMRLRCRNGGRVLASHSPALGVSDPAVEFGYVGLINEFVRRLADGDDTGAEWRTAAAMTEAIMASLSRAGPVKGAK